MTTEILRPNGSGDLNNIQYEVGAASPNHYQNVDEVTADDETTMVYDDGGGMNYDSYTLTNPVKRNLPISHIILHGKFMIDHDSDILLALHEPEWILRIDGTPYTYNICNRFAPAALLEGVWTSRASTDSGASGGEISLNPKTGLVWTVSDLDNLQLGCGLIRPRFSSLNKEYCTQLYVEVFYEGVGVEMASLDITDKILGVRTERGKDSELGHAATGIALITVDNFGGDFSPENSGGAYFGTLDLGVLIEVYEIYLGVRYDHFTGKLDKIVPNAEPDNLIASLIGLDGSDDLNIIEIETALRTATDSNTLAGDILDAAAWPAADRDLDAGVDTFAVAWFHQVLALVAFHGLELQEKSFFYIDVDGDAQWEDRHHRLSGAHIVSQADFEDTAIELPYEWSKRNIGNYARLTGKRYTVDAANSYLWGIFTGASGAPLIPAGSSITLWAVFSLALASYVTPLTAGTHWNANTAFDKTGTDVTSDVSVVETQYGQLIKMVWTNAGTVGAYLVVPGTPPAGAPADRTAIIMGKLYQEDEITHIEEDSASQTSYGKRAIDIEATYKSNPNDLRAYGEWLIARFKDPVPSAVSVTHKAMTAWPDDTIKIQCLSRKISDRITVKSTKHGIDQDYYINKVIQDYQLRSGIFEHRCTWVVERAEGVAESLFWLLGEAGFSELGETTKLGF